MTRFRFRLQVLLDLKGRKLEELEADIARLQARRAASEALAEEARHKAAEARESAVAGDQIDVGALRAGSAWAARLDEDAAAALAASRRLALEVQDALGRRVSLARELKGLERLREKALAAHRRASDLEEEATATELFLARRAARR